jgi:hypothetical protein
VLLEVIAGAGRGARCLIANKIVDALVHADEAALECVTPPAPAGTRTEVLVSLDGQQAWRSYGFSFLYVQEPVVQHTTPLAGFAQARQPIVVYGSFSPAPSLCCLFGGVPTRADLFNSSTLVCEAPGDAFPEGGSVPFVVSADGQTGIHVEGRDVEFVRRSAVATRSMTVTPTVPDPGDPVGSAGASASASPAAVRLAVLGQLAYPELYAFPRNAWCRASPVGIDGDDVIVEGTFTVAGAVDCEIALRDDFAPFRAPLPVAKGFAQHGEREVAIQVTVYPPLGEGIWSQPVVIPLRPLPSAVWSVERTGPSSAIAYGRFLFNSTELSCRVRALN